MQQDMAMEQERAGGRWIPEIHSNLNAVIWTLAFPVRNFDGIAHVAIRYRLPIDFKHLEMNLMDMEGVGFKRAIFDGPIFDRSDLGRDHGLLISLEDSLFLSVDCDVELDGTVGAAEFLGEIELPLRGRLRMREVGELKRARWCRRRLLGHV